MMLKRCIEHGYTLNEKCLMCGKDSIEAHYKFNKMRDVNEIYGKKKGR